MQHILVTGGAGFIGSHTVETLLAAGLAVTVLDNLSSGARKNLPDDSRLQLIAADICDQSAVNAAMVGVDAVLHLAAQVSVQTSIEHPVESARTNIQGFLHVLDSARQAGVRRVVYASSAAVYGVPQQLPVMEQAPACPLSPYGLEKSVNDQYAALYHDLYGLSCLGLRYFNVYGPRQDPGSQYAGVISKFNEAARSGCRLNIFGDGMQTRDFIYVGDVARANLAALTASLQGFCNIGTGQSVTLLQMVQALRDVTGCPLPVDHHPARAGDIRDSCAMVARMRHQLGFEAKVPLVDGLAQLWASLT